MLMFNSQRLAQDFKTITSHDLSYYRVILRSGMQLFHFVLQSTNAMLFFVNYFV